MGFHMESLLSALSPLCGFFITNQQADKIDNLKDDKSDLQKQNANLKDQNAVMQNELAFQNGALCALESKDGG